MKHNAPFARSRPIRDIDADFPFCSERCRDARPGQLGHREIRGLRTDLRLKKTLPRAKAKTIVLRIDDLDEARMTPTTDTSAASAPRKKPRLALAIATALGVGYLKPAPGTWGSLVVVARDCLSSLHVVPRCWSRAHPAQIPASTRRYGLARGAHLRCFWSLRSCVWSGGRVARRVEQHARSAAYAGIEDPQFVVIDEVSGVQLALMLALVPLALPPASSIRQTSAAFALFTGMSCSTGNICLLGFVLFRVFDIWKPFPCRRLEKLPGGWGIMADDWMAGIYAAFCCVSRYTLICCPGTLV